MSEPRLDKWAKWLLHRRHGEDPEALEATLETLYSFRDRVLANACVAPEDRVLDVGCGDGLIAFGALERLGPRGEVVFSDISQDLLDQCRAIADEMGVLERCRFVKASAESLMPIESTSIDVVTTRSVLIYVTEKGDAFKEFHRVLRPRGRLSIFEPINRFPVSLPDHLRGGFHGYDVTPVSDIAQKMAAVYKAQEPEVKPMIDFDERDLIRFAAESDFVEIHLDFRVDITQVKPRRWEALLHSSGNPMEPTLEEIMDEVLTCEEKRCFSEYLRPLVESGSGMQRSATAYLWATRP